MLQRKPQENVTELGTGINLDHPDDVIDLRIADKVRKGHFWCFGTTRVGKTRLLENIIEQDIRKGYSVMAIDPKGDLDLFSKIAQVALLTGRKDDLMLVTPIFPQCSACVNPLWSHYMPEELVDHIVAGIAVGKEPFFANLAYEVTLNLVLALLLKARNEERSARFTLLDIKNRTSYDDLKTLKSEMHSLSKSGRDASIQQEAEQIALNLEKITLASPDNYAKVASSLRIALTELTAGNIGKVIGTEYENKFISRLEAGKQVIVVVQLGSLLTRKAAYTAGKVMISMLQGLIGRLLASGKVLSPPLALHMDEAQSILYQGIEELFAKAGGANLYIHGYSQSISQLYDTVGQEKARTILDNCNTKIFMRVPDADTAEYVSDHLGEGKVFSPIIGLGGQLSIRETEELRIKPSHVLNLNSRQFYLTTYDGIFKGFTSEVDDAQLEVAFPDITQKHAEEDVC